MQNLAGSDPSAGPGTLAAGGPGVGSVAFAEVSAVAPAGPGGFTSDIHPEWTLGGHPNGGYLLAVLARAATWRAEDQHVIAAGATFLRSPSPGRVAIDVELLRAGRSASHVRARMSQDGQPCVEALLTVAGLPDGDPPYWDGGAPAPGDVAFGDCVPLPAGLPDGGRVAIMDVIDVRLEPATAGFLSGRPSGRGELRGWLALPGGEPFDPVSLLFALDSFPPASFDVEYAGWVPTMQLTAYVRARPAAGPVRVAQRAGLVAAGRLDQTCAVWDGEGRLVAQATQLAGVRLG